MTTPQKIITVDEDHAARFVDDERVNWKNPIGRVLSPQGVASTYFDSFNVRLRFERPRVLQLCRYDPGSAAYRYHSAFNSAAVNAHGVSAFVRYENTNPHCDLRQYDGMLQRDGVRRLFESADVVHVHMEYSVLSDPAFYGRWPDRSRQMLVRHYHGSTPTSANYSGPALVEQAMDDNENAVQIGARLYHQRFSERMHWLPIPMPVHDYELIGRQYFVPIEQRKVPRLRIAHSPTYPRIKGTMALQCAVDEVRMRGHDVDLIMIKDMSHADALRLKASCDISFDSFWLGIQGSGLEAACMGQVVIAGDPEVKAEYEREIGYCPYTYAYGFDELVPLLEQLLSDAAFRASEAARVARYVRTYHDYAVVGEKYWDIISAEAASRGFRYEAPESRVTAAAR